MMNIDFTDIKTPAGALFSNDRTRRLLLWRNWDASKKVAMCIGLNPSTAAEFRNDRTIDFLMRALQNLGYGGLLMVNLFTQVTSRPDELNPSVDIDDDVIDLFAVMSQEIIVCWGTFKEARERGKSVAAIFPDALCFGVNSDGSPRHPAWFVRNGVKTSTVELQRYRI